MERNRTIKALKNNRGITLTTLIITIVILIILVGTGLKVIIDGNIVGSAENSVNKGNDRIAAEQGILDEAMGEWGDVPELQCPHRWREWTIINANEKTRTCTVCDITQTLKITDNYYATITNTTGRNISNYKIYGNSVQTRLPKEYQEVEYVESTGTQYLEIDYIASGITRSRGKYQITNTSKAAFLFGSRASAGTNFYGFNWGGGTPYKYYNSYKDGAATTAEIDDQIHTFYKDKGYLYIDNTLIKSTSEKSFTTPSKMNIFACHNNGTAGYLPPYARIYNLQFFDNETLMVDLVPCYRKSDEEVGMYDLVSETFYTNKGTGTFVKGNNSGPTPETPIEIRSVGDYDEETGKYKIPIKVSNDTEECTINIYLSEPLRKIGSYEDYIDFEEQKVYRYIKEKIFNGTETWTKYSTYNTYHTTDTDLKYDTNISCFSNKYNGKTSGSGTSYGTGNVWIQSTSTYPRIYFADDSYTTLSAWTEYLKANNVKGYFVLATPDDTETIDLPNIPTFNGTTIIEVDTSVKPSKIEIE